MGSLDGRVCIITGAGRGIGREHSLLFASEGAKIVVNDLGGDIDGSGEDRAPAQLVVDEIKAMGGEAVANLDNVADWDGAQRLVQTAIDTFGDLHVLVNNAGILRDRVLVNMTEAEWDAVIHVHLKGHFCPTRFAAAYWREQSKAGKEVRASVINTSSTSGLIGNPGQTNYGAAKSGIATFSIIASQELGRYGVRVNGPDAHDGRDAGSRRSRASTGRPVEVRCVGPRQHLAVRRLPRHRELPGDGQGVLRAGWPGAFVPTVGHGRNGRERRPLVGRRTRNRDEEDPRLVVPTRRPR
jgi:NAD(P)-dependent dehydrogenase (short-subunit alcohol dehydrogenase family)